MESPEEIPQVTVKTQEQGSVSEAFSDLKIFQPKFRPASNNTSIYTEGTGSFVN